MTTAEGGMLTGTDTDRLKQARLCRFHGVSRDSFKRTGSGQLPHYESLFPAFKLNMTDLAASIGIHQLKKIDTFNRSRAVLDEPAIHKWNLCTGPQAVAGSTRMQATTIETFVLGVLLEELAFRLLRDRIAETELAGLGFVGDPGVAGRLAAFADVRGRVERARSELASLTRLESEAYRAGRRATYAAGEGMVAVFTDCTFVWRSGPPWPPVRSSAFAATAAAAAGTNATPPTVPRAGNARRQPAPSMVAS